MCTEKVCLEYVRMVVNGPVFRVGIGYENGRPFSALVIDARGSGEHLHFPAADVLAHLPAADVLAQPDHHSL